MPDGWLVDTLPGFVRSCPITVLRLHGDWYDSTPICVRRLSDRVRAGEVVPIDDWDGCLRAIRDFLSEGKRTERIHQAGRGLAHLLKTQGEPHSDPLIAAACA